MKHRTEGFTLLELLVAIGLMALLSVLGYRGLDSLLRSRDNLGRRDEALALLAQTWTWLERDLSALLPATASAGVAPRVIVSPDEHGQPILTLTTAHADTADGRRTPRSVSYRIAGGSLERRERPAVAVGGKVGDDELLLLVPSAAWQIEQWVDGRGWTAGESFQVVRPVAIKVSLRTAGSNFVRLFTVRP